MTPARRAGLLVLGLVLAAVLAVKAAEWYTEWLWFGSVGYTVVLTRLWATRLLLLTVGFLLALWVLRGNFLLSRRAPRPRWARLSAEPTLGAGVWEELPNLLVPVAWVLGLQLARSWDRLLAAHYLVASGHAEPVFGRDVSFYLLRLPWLNALQHWLMLLCALAWLGLYLRYLELPELGNDERTLRLESLPSEGIAHLSWTGALVLAVWGWGCWLTRYRLLVSARSTVVAGVNYCDAHVRLPLLSLLAVAAGLAALALLVNARRRSLVTLWLVPLLFAVGVGVALALPAAFQRLVVAPNEVAYEQPYIQRCIEATRAGLGLDRIKSTTGGTAHVASSQPLPAELPDVPLWSAHELSEQLVGTQALRTYYSFTLADFDRYRLGGRRTPVGLMLREMQVDRLESGARSWVNRHLLYTHGYGVALASASAVGAGGGPLTLAGDLPQRLPAGETLTQPRVYYGETPQDYCVTNGATPEFDYPQGETNATTVYAGRGGVRLGRGLRRLAWAVRLRSVNLLISRLVTAESRVHLRRAVPERLAALAPFLDLDSDPYPVLAAGRLTWLADGYSVSGNYPYGWRFPLFPAQAIAEEQPEHFARGTWSYVRNSVKATVDAADGTVSFHVIDAADPIARTWMRALPGLLRAEPLPAALAEHVRYPGDLFGLQARAYGRFHMAEPALFYSGEDQWDFAREETTLRSADELGRYKFSVAQERLVPYYLLQREPGESESRFRLLVPLTPAGGGEATTRRDNLIAWLTAECDPAHYGELTCHTLPKGELVYGPLQMEARINQDPVISQQLTLWGQQGSQVLRGRLLVIPVGDALLYAEPLFITAERRGALPELKRVVVVYNDRVAMAESLEEAVKATLGQARPTADPSLQRALGEARTALEAATAARRAGDLAGFGDGLERVRRALGAQP